MDENEVLMKDRLQLALLLIVPFLALSSTVAASTTWYVNGVSGSDRKNCMLPSTATISSNRARGFSTGGGMSKSGAAASVYRRCGVLTQRSFCCLDTRKQST